MSVCSTPTRVYTNKLVGPYPWSWPNLLCSMQIYLLTYLTVTLILRQDVRVGVGTYESSWCQRELLSLQPAAAVISECECVCEWCYCRLSYCLLARHRVAGCHGGNYITPTNAEKNIRLQINYPRRWRLLVADPQLQRRWRWSRCRVHRCRNFPLVVCPCCARHGWVSVR